MTERAQEAGRGAPTAVESALAGRARIAVAAREGARPAAAAASGASAIPDPGLVASLRHHLHAGETHYPARPGMVPLRERVGSLLPAVGYAARPADGVLITAGEGESLLVTLLGLGVAPGGTVLGPSRSRHAELLAWLEVGAVAEEHGGEDGSVVRYREGSGAGDGGEEPGRGTVVHNVGDALFRDAGAGAPGGERATESDSTVVIGSFDGLAGMEPFRLGWVAAAPSVLAGITKWKQASSICAPAPAQRAALWALGARP